MKVKLESDLNTQINGVDVTLLKGTEIDLPCDGIDAAASISHAAKLPVDLSHKEGKVQVMYGAGGKRVELEPEKAVAVEEPKAKPKPKEVEKPKAPKKAAPKAKATPKAKAPEPAPKKAAVKPEAVKRAKKKK